jgi:hypothetical protein
MGMGTGTGTEAVWDAMLLGRSRECGVLKESN